MLKVIKTPTFAEFIKLAINKNMLELHTCIPGKIKEYDESKQKATVVPLLKKKFKDTNGTIANLPILNNVPVFNWSCNNRKTFIHMPLKTGDLGMIIFCDRSIDNYLSSSPQDDREVEPSYHDSPRHHDLSDAWFLPGILPFEISLQNISSSDIIIKNDNFTISISPDGKITINNGTNELIETLSTLIQNLINAKTLTLIGAQPFTADTIVNLISDKTKIDSFKE